MRIQQPVQINLSPVGQTTVLQKFAGLGAGDTVSVQVISLEGQKLRIMTQDGAPLLADFKGEMFFLPGDRLDLTLESRRGGRVSLRLSSVNGQPLRMEVSETEGSLLRSGIEPTRQNMLASRILQQNGYTPDANNVANFSRIMGENPQMPDEVAAFFSANNIEPEEEVVRLLAQIQEEPSLLANRADALASTLRQLYPSAVQGEPATPQTVFAQPAGQQTAAKTPPSGRDFMASVLQIIKETKPQAAPTVATSPRFQAIAGELPKLPPHQAQAAIHSFVSSLALRSDEKQTVSAALYKVYLAQTQPEREPQPMQANDPVAWNANMTQPSKNAAASGGPAPHVQTLQTLFQKLSEFFVTIQPSDASVTAKDLQNIVRKQERLAEDIETAVANLAGGKHTVTREASDMRSQINLNTGLENFYYFQIPVQFREQKTTAELYVFERNRRAQELKEDCTILIALDTKNMGRTETLLRADGGGLDIRFRLGSESLCRFAEAGAQELRQSLAEEGFQVKNLAFEVLETKTTPLNAQSVFAGMNGFVPGGLNIEI